MKIEDRYLHIHTETSSSQALFHVQYDQYANSMMFHLLSFHDIHHHTHIKAQYIILKYLHIFTKYTQYDIFRVKSQNHKAKPLPPEPCSSLRARPLPSAWRRLRRKPGRRCGNGTWRRWLGSLRGSGKNKVYIGRWVEKRRLYRKMGRKNIEKPPLAR